MRPSAPNSEKYFDISKFPEFKRELEQVSWDNSDWGSKELFKVSHLVQAVLGNMIYDRIFFFTLLWNAPRFLSTVSRYLRYEVPQYVFLF